MLTCCIKKHHKKDDYTLNQKIKSREPPTQTVPITPKQNDPVDLKNGTENEPTTGSSPLPRRVRSLSGTSFYSIKSYRSTDQGDYYSVCSESSFKRSIVFTLLGRFSIVKPYNLVLLYEPLKRFQIWRLLTSVLYYPIQQAGFHYLINLYFLYNYSRRLEEGAFAGKPADYLFLLIFNWICCIILGLIAELPILMDPMILSVLYVWCQLNKDTIVSFWFGTRFKAIYLPWVLLAFNLVLSGGGIMELFGILIGHLYFFLMFKYPQELGGPSLLQTPAFLKGLFPDQVGGVHGFGVPPERAAGAPGGAPRGRGMFGGHNWGPGHTLHGN
ncbi:unnamed protein product [Phaedon cochleariae]|uniref:Derlin n=1 Tax=Phaedon cochleariae TaxID=80249 RepID=A0A9N9SID0_PHACE|nr:unnamed protein product [Phaedon cochleariae]